MITERINNRKQEKEALEGQLAVELSKQFILTEKQVSDFLYMLKKSKSDDLLKRKSMVNIFVSHLSL